MKKYPNRTLKRNKNAKNRTVKEKLEELETEIENLTTRKSRRTKNRKNKGTGKSRNRKTRRTRKSKKNSNRKSRKNGNRKTRYRKKFNQQIIYYPT